MAGAIVGRYHALQGVFTLRAFAEARALPTLPGTWDDAPVVTRALTFLGDRLFLTFDDFREIEDRARLAAFSFAGATSKSMVRVASKSLERSLRLGHDADRAARDLNAALTRAGYNELNPWHARLVARQTFANAYGAASFEALMDPSLAGIVPMFRYVTQDDDRVRPAHAALHNKVFLRDATIWLSIWPPNGYNCRCFVRGVTIATVERLGLVPDTVPRWTTDAHGNRIRVVPDEGFAGSPSRKFNAAVRSGRRA